jgi:hypothetical protein
MRLTLNQRRCGHASLCWLEMLGSARFRAHERRSPDQERMEDRRNRSKARRNTRAQLTSTRYGRSAWRCPVWRRAQHGAHQHSRFAENSWRACLLPIVRNHVYHPAFGGSFSLKAVLPALVPEMTYAGMEVANGQDAGLAWESLVRGWLDCDDSGRIRKALLNYCGQDTLALLKLGTKLRSISTGLIRCD